MSYRLMTKATKMMRDNIYIHFSKRRSHPFVIVSIPLHAKWNAQTSSESKRRRITKWPISSQLGLLIIITGRSHPFKLPPPLTRAIIRLDDTRVSLAIN
jgi:hypothetical protein